MSHVEHLLDSAKFRDPLITAKGERRAVVALTRLRTLWFNTGSLCNLTCEGCYVDSSPKNDRLAYITADEVRGFLNEIARDRLPVEEIGFTGGEPFMNPDLCAMLEDCLGRGLRCLVLTNAMKPMLKVREQLLDIRARHGDALTLRVSIDHHEPENHDSLRGEHSWRRMSEGVEWLVSEGFNLTVAGRTCWTDSPEDLRRGFAGLFRRLGLDIDADDPTQLILFPEMDEHQDVPEITVGCWDILGIKPETIMCAEQRMVIKRKGAAGPVVVPCTLLPYDTRFEMGQSLAEASRAVRLNHPHCAKFCVLGGGSCSVE
ncbi:radical SAM protein [Magnetospira sp. QH-2]|uniref:radical SAM protein n=1 Tax=Magnetospira sp. (strain QH-2) TaxID=1288970 RepID=UPI0003E814EF|nr:radical SAM protein [Magnetospira sp. QH-2]CCQ72259.1 Putative Molybdenum cofactor biosynthesis protein A (Radical SAM domain protein) [Magnetospira sp. QH-2]